MATNGKPANIYVLRQAGTFKCCYVCHKSSRHVLVSQSIPTLDFIYVCHAHLADRHFANKLSEPASSSSTTSTAGGGGVGGGGGGGGGASGERLPDKVSQSEIDKIKAEYEARLKAKEKESKPFSAMSVAGSVFSTVTSTVSGLASTAISSIATEAPPLATAASAAPTSAESLAKQHPLHATYSLHREFYAARVREWNKKMVKKKASELNMPPAPKNALP
ncbi:uncharacterized protein UBRO_08739 [Ustilago bromivora]|uniref:DUF1742-domain-containing protein n=1 Tax=Ustilago bromivora TaxID=307758 RepID=A0A1K0GDX4_9BASI|nr:uncharacterized protein UBRO_08739 [Ustilago bromivora]SYW80338.1 uncharacterized protein UBRO2_03606 [Ustilago bromivora]